MLQIRSTQIAFFAAAARAVFIDQTTKRLCELFPGDPPRGLAKDRLWVADAIARGVGVGLRLETELQRWVELPFHLGGDFRVEPTLNWVCEMLDDSRRPVEFRVEAVYTEMFLRA